MTKEEQAFLTITFSMEELHSKAFRMESNKPARPDGFNIEFYQKFWEIIKTVLFALLEHLYDNELDIDRLNYGVITLIPKGSDTDRIRKYRPICLLNVVFEIITKVMVNTLIAVIKGKIRCFQITFLKGRYKFEGILIPHETLKKLDRKKAMVSF